MKITGIVDVNAVHTHKWANFFASSGHEIQLISFEPPRDGVRRHLHSSIKVVDWIIPKFHLKRLWITANGIHRMRSILREFVPDLVHAQLLTYSAWYAAVASSYPLVVSVMGGGDIVGDTWRATSIQEKYLTPYTLRHTVLAVCWSSNLQRIVRPMLRPGIPCEVVLGGVDLETFKGNGDVLSLRSSFGLKPDNFIVFSPRLFRPLSNIDTLIEAMAIVVRHVPSAHLLLVKYRAECCPDYVRRIEHLIDALRLRSHITMVADIANEEMPLYYNASDCTVSIPETDGTPMTVMESAACGTPVIIQDLPEYASNVFIHEQTVLKVPRRSKDGLAQALIRLATDGDLKARLRVRGEAMVRDFCEYTKEMKRLERMYWDVLWDKMSPHNGGEGAGCEWE